MAEIWRQQHPLAHLHLRARARDGDAPDTDGEAGVRLHVRGFDGQVGVRGEETDPGFRAAFEAGFGFAPPPALRGAGGGDVSALWLGPSEWLLVTPGDGAALAERARQALAGCHSAVTDVSDSRCVIRASGPRVRELLAKASSLDLHPRVFETGMCAQSLLARTHMLLHQVADDPVYDIYVHRSFADYAWRWLEDAAREYGLAIGGPG